MRTLIRKATILTLDPGAPAGPFTGDLLIDGTRIAAIAPDLGEPADVRVIDGRDRLVMPGLINAHLHSGEAFYKGRYDNMPLEIWMLYAYPILMGAPLDLDMLRLRTLLVAIDSLKNGVTCLTDDLFDPPSANLDRLGAVFGAYAESGIRATVSSNVGDKKVLDTIPFTRELLPADLQALADRSVQPTVAAYMDFCKAATERFHGSADGRMRYMIAPSAPQRVTAEMMQACHDFALAHGMPLHTHILETKVQAVTGPEFYGRTLIRYMKDLGVLTRNTTIAHSIWVTDEDIALMGEAGCSIAHNAISNQKLGAGCAPIRRLLDAGVTVALGSDGLCSNDTARMFDVMHVAAILHKVAGPDYERWITAQEVLNACTYAGAKSAMIEQETGSLAAGKAADLLILSMRGVDWTPLNDVRNHLVYCENGSSIETVFVNGDIVVEKGRLTKIDEDAILTEIRARMPGFLAAHAEVEKRNAAFHPYFHEIHRRATLQDIGINRYQGDLPAWPGRNAP